VKDGRRPPGAAVNSAAEDDTGSGSRFADRRQQVTPLQDCLIAFYLLLEDARSELEPRGWQAFVWIATDRIGLEAAQLVVDEALEATSEEAA
jgi:hypothetical protein